MSSTSDTLSQATRHHLAGQLADAERLYRQILSVEPGNAQAMHQLGTLAIQVGQLEPAIELLNSALKIDQRRADTLANLAEVYRRLGKLEPAIGYANQAMKLNPNLPAAHSVLGELLHQQGNLPAAAERFRAAIKLEPENAHLRTLLGEVLFEMEKWSDAEACFRRAVRIDENDSRAQYYLANTLQQLSRDAEAAEHYQTLLRLSPDHVAARINLGAIYQTRRDFAAAAEEFRHAVRLAPENSVALSNLGSTLSDLGSVEEALSCCQRAVEIDPQLDAAHYNIGYLLQNAGRHEEAIAAYNRSIALNPNVATSYGKLGSCLQALSRNQESIQAFRETVRIDPTDMSALCNLGVLLGEMGYYTESLAPFQQACRLDPKFSEGYYNQACSLYQLDRFDDAIEVLNKALEFTPTYHEAQMQLGNCYKMLGRMPTAIEHYRKSMELAPTQYFAHSNLVYSLNFMPELTPEEIFAEHLQFGRKHANPLTNQALPHENDRSPDRKLRIGYVSGHFFAHAVNFFSEPILASHNHTQFEVFCYSDVPQEDKVTARLRGFADHWRNIAGSPNPNVAEQIREDKIDILVDLAGHIAGGRLLVFARKPAPVQVTYIGYQNTTGMQAMDYRLTDDWSDPPGTTDAFYTEQLVRLPRTFFCYLPARDAPLAEGPPCVANGYVTFGSFNNFSKITPKVLACWSEILLAVPGSRLILLAALPDGLNRYILDSFAGHGVVAERIELVQKCKRSEYMAWIGRTDIALDPFPFNGHTTTCDTLWMGVPVVMLAGKNYASRFGSSALATLGLERWVAHSVEQYQQIAVQLSRDTEQLTEMRKILRDRMLHSPVCDAPTFTRNLEASYREMWRKWCASAPA